MNIENHRRLGRIQYETWRTRAHNHLGNTCVVCGATENLEIDHINPALKTCNPSSMKSWSWELQLIELANCQLLCRSCHKSKSISERVVPHGGGKTGKYNCTCDPCRLKKNEYLRDLKRRKRAEAKLVK